MKTRELLETTETELYMAAFRKIAARAGMPGLEKVIFVRVTEDGFDTEWMVDRASQWTFVPFENMSAGIAEIIAKVKTSALLSLRYAKEVVRGPWPSGEAAIAKDPMYSRMYAEDVIKGPWPPGEAAIASNAQAACIYAQHVIKGRWPPGEKAIMGVKQWARVYADDWLGRHWPEAGIL